MRMLQLGLENVRVGQFPNARLTSCPLEGIVGGGFGVKAI